LDIQNAAFMIPRAMTTIVQEGIEPLLIGEKLLQKIQYKPGMTTVFPAIEPLRADEAGDGMDLPQYNINIGGAQSFGAPGRGAACAWRSPSDSWMRPGLSVLWHNNKLARARERRRSVSQESTGSGGKAVFQPVGLFAGGRGRLHITSLRAPALMGQIVR
jgi:hypothetical protein